MKRPRANASKRKTTKRNTMRTEQFPTCREMSKVLSFGRRANPTCMVVILHGLHDCASSSKALAQRWAKGLTGSLVLVPQSPDVSMWSSKDDVGYDWLRQRGRQNTADDEANIKELQRVTRIRSRHLEQWLGVMLKKHGVTKKRLVLAGFSQGSILAAVCAVRLRALGAIVCGGVTGQPVYSATTDDYVGGGWMQWERLLPKSHRCTKFCAINGTCDGYVQRAHLEYMLQPFDCHWHWDEGLGHDFPEKWNTIGLRWMKRILQ